MSNGTYKLLHISFHDGAAMTIHPNHITFAKPNQNLMHCDIGIIGIGAAVIAKPYTLFIRHWQAALEGRDIPEQDRT